mmetsp:Transcript_33996/g.106531  ORF Transcript_33996/g.106531 Transcript_33996/m.106531 type:complete len:230 (+) Transcript_33996:1517-2206(+)
MIIIGIVVIARVISPLLPRCQQNFHQLRVGFRAPLEEVVDYNSCCCHHDRYDQLERPAESLDTVSEAIAEPSLTLPAQLAREAGGTVGVFSSQARLWVRALLHLKRNLGSDEKSLESDDLASTRAASSERALLTRNFRRRRESPWQTLNATRSGTHYLPRVALPDVHDYGIALQLLLRVHSSHADDRSWLCEQLQATPERLSSVHERFYLTPQLRPRWVLGFKMDDLHA